MNELGGLVKITLVPSKLKTISKLEINVDLLHEEYNSFSNFQLTNYSNLTTKTS